ncbi:MAG: HEPN domain-containing protein, partial [Gammaproteobacteria bacterium]
LPHLWVIGFHAQQAVEKSLKALLVHHQIEFPKTHKLGELFDLLAGAEPALEDSLRQAAALNRYGADIRYPSDLPELTWEQATEAVRLAGKVRDAVRSRLKG